MNTFIDEKKRRLRKLKKWEHSLFFDGGSAAALIWDSFFCLRESASVHARYSLAAIEAMDSEKLKAAIGEYLSFLYEAIYQKESRQPIINYDPQALLQLGLSPSADERQIKQKFHELAKQCHPDTGGNAEQFCALMEAYRKLTRS